MKKFCFALDLKNNEALIEEYKEHHRNFWPELREHARHSGIRMLELYNIGNRLFMVVEVDDEGRSESPVDSYLVARNKEWEKLMAKYQQPIFPEKKEKWSLMEKIFEL